ncbi:hypothetical protein [Limimaricola pyoseonensis]|uniref:Uncharacterized protein n=1 Tax=Limimaricola pyoseonensis TaxID=521013 RepID=A0A1G7IG08_9RHOB|nr:hypothetical protein [Limimaricola pyoseonensis]SDF11671.1 hypothetical protein SAMN04488567_3454 [Limimaricola pyoseonensis]
MPNGLLLDHCIDPAGEVNAKILARALGVDVFDLMRTAPTQRHLKDLHCILCVIRPWTRSATDTWSWYHSKRLARFGGRTPAILVNEDRCAELKDFLEAGEALTNAWPPALEIRFLPKDVRPAANG